MIRAIGIFASLTRERSVVFNVQHRDGTVAPPTPLG